MTGSVGQSLQDSKDGTTEQDSGDRRALTGQGTQASLAVQPGQVILGITEMTGWPEHDSTDVSTGR